MKKLSLFALLFFICGCQDPHGRSFDERNVGVVNGKEVQSDDPIAQSTVIIFVMNKEGTSTEYQCSGSLLKDDLVVTAAHCVFPKNKTRDLYPTERLIVYFGNFTDAGLEAVKMGRVAQVSSHPKYRGYFEEGLDTMDIALLKLSQPAPSPFRPASILSPSVLLAKKQSVLIAGFGDNRNKKQQYLRLLRQYEGYKISSTTNRRFAVELKTSSRQGSYYGDSGGPAFVKGSDGLKLWGVFSSFNFEYGSSTYEDIRKHRAWIEEASRKMGSEFRMEMDSL